ncbi:MAG TPA: hypothetical protein VH414_07085 [Lichenihabitans sp.]|jgi:hypothetical protein|nr:hypothetical protein [Lichenihabitans sp.]
MIKLGRTALPTTIAALACAALLGTAGAAQAQSADRYGPDAMHSRARHLVKHNYARPAGHYRALTVRRRRPVEPEIAILPPPPAGPGVIVTGPIRAASAIVDLPFRILGDIFPAQGSVAANPLVLVGAPIQAAGRIAQVPFRIAEAPFEPAPAVYTGPELF